MRAVVSSTLLPARPLVGEGDVEQARVAVAAGLRERVDHGAGEGAELGRGADADCLDLLDDVEVVEGPGRAAGGVARVDAVDQQRVARRGVAAVGRLVVDAGQA